MRKRKLAPKLTPGEAKERWADAHPPFSHDEYVHEANRCLYCYEAPCIVACPTQIDIPSFIKKIAFDDLKGSARTILEANPLGGSCARVCPTEVLCEGACVYNRWDRPPILIGRLQQVAMDHVFEEKYEPLPPEPKRPEKIAVVGAGPAGLSCAAVLARKGYGVTIYDAQEKAGGLNTYGVAMYKATPKYSLREVASIRKLGVRFRQGVRIGNRIKVSDLLSGNAAVFMGPGLGKETRLGIPGENLRGVMPALDFLEEIHVKPVDTVRAGNTVVIVGCGNTAIDAARAAKRLGATNVIVLYRRTENEMPAYQKEHDEAVAEGCEFRWLTNPVKIMGRGTVTGIRCVTMKLGAKDASGRRRPVPVKGSEHTIECDQVVYSIGQGVDTTFMAAIEGLKTDRKGLVRVNAESMETSVPRLFAGGDCINGGKEVVNAAQDGKVAANAINEMIKNAKGVPHDRSHS